VSNKLGCIGFDRSPAYSKAIADIAAGRLRSGSATRDSAVDRSLKVALQNLGGYF